MFAIQFGGSKLQNKFKNYFDISIFYEEWNEKTSVSIWNYLVPEFCTKEHFPNNSQQQFEDLKLKTAFCLPLNYTERLIKNDTFERLLYLMVKPCDIANPDCVDLSKPENQNKFDQDFPYSIYLNYYTTNS